MKLVNTDVERALRALGYDQGERSEILAHIDAHRLHRGRPRPRRRAPAGVRLRVRRAGRAHDRPGGPRADDGGGAAVHLRRHQQDGQPAELGHGRGRGDIYTLGWTLGLKAIAIYRDGSKRTQPLSTTDGTRPLPGPPRRPRRPAPVRRRLPDDRAALTHKFSVGGQEGYITVGLYDDGSPGEVFVKMSKQGSTVSGLMDSVAIAWSMALQHGVPIESLISKYIDHRFEPSGFTGNPRIPMARSVVDYLARWMASKFLSEEDQRIAGVLPGVSPEPEAGDATDDAPEDQLSFSAVAEPEAEANGNGNGNGHGATATAEPPSPPPAPVPRLDGPDLLVLRQLRHGPRRHLPHLPDLRRHLRLRLIRTTVRR